MRKLWRTKGNSWNGFYRQVGAPHSEGGKMPERMVVTRTVVSKKEKRAPGCEARRDGQTLLFCVSEGGFAIRTTLVSTAAYP